MLIPFVKAIEGPKLVTHPKSNERLHKSGGAIQGYTSIAMLLVVRVYL